MSGLEAIGIAASIIQVADTGIRLAENIYAYTDSVRSADRTLSKIAGDVRLTANLVNHVGSLFNNEEFAAGAGEKELRTANGCIKRCETAYGEVESYLRKARKSKWIFPLREKKLDILNARLEQLKSDLHLMLSVVKNKSDLKAAVERKGHLEQRDLYFLKEIQVLRRAQQASDRRFRNLKAEYETFAKGNPEIDDEETVVGDGENVRKDDVESIVPEIAATTHSHSSKASPEALEEGRLEQAVRSFPERNLGESEQSITLHQEDSANDAVTSFDRQDLQHLSTHINRLLERIESLQWRLQQRNQDFVSAEDTHQLLSVYNDADGCIKRALNGFHPTSALPSTIAQPCAHQYYVRDRLAERAKMIAPAWGSFPKPKPMIAIGQAQGLGSTTFDINTVIDGLNKVTTWITEPSKHKIHVPAASAGSATGSSVLGTGAGAVQSGLSWLYSSSSKSDEEEKEVKRKASYAILASSNSNMMEERDVDFDGVERLLREYTTVFDDGGDDT